MNNFRVCRECGGTEAMWGDNPRCDLCRGIATRLSVSDIMKGRDNGLQILLKVNDESKNERTEQTKKEDGERQA